MYLEKDLAETSQLQVGLGSISDALDEFLKFDHQDASQLDKPEPPNCCFNYYVPGIEDLDAPERVAFLCELHNKIRDAPQGHILYNLNYEVHDVVSLGITNHIGVYMGWSLCI